MPGHHARHRPRPAEPASLLVPNCTWSTQAAGGLIVSGPLKGIAFGVGGVPYQFNYGRVLSTLMYGGLPNPDDPHASPNGDWLLEAPHYRYTALAKFTYDFSDDLHLTFMYNFGHNEQRGLSTFHQQTALTILRNNPFIPASIQAAMDANKLTSIVVGEDEQMDGGKQFFQSDTAHRGMIDLKGKFGEWSWDVAATHGQSQSPAPLLTNLYEGNFLEAMYAIPGPLGQPVCGPIATNPNLGPGTVGSGYETKIAPGPCVPYNIFGPTINVTQQGAGKNYAIVNENPVLYNNPSASVAAVEIAGLSHPGRHQLPDRRHHLRRERRPVRRLGGHGFRRRRFRTSSQRRQFLLRPLEYPFVRADQQLQRLCGQVPGRRRLCRNGHSAGQGPALGPDPGHGHRNSRDRLLAAGLPSPPTRSA